MARGESAHELHFPIRFLTPTARFIDNGDALRVASRHSSQPMQCGRQIMAVCDESGLIAIANGRLVELYQADAVQKPVVQIDHDGSCLQPPATRPLHLPFAGQIVLSDVIYGVEDSPTNATSLYFPAPDVLFVASTTFKDADDTKTTEESTTSTRLSGFRLYWRRIGGNSHRAACLRPQEPFTIVTLFSDEFTGVAPIATMEPVPRSSFQGPDRGAIVVLFEQNRETAAIASSLGVFQWTERYSDREFSLTKPFQAMPSALTSVAVSEDAQWIAVGDVSGGVTVLDFRRFVWDPEMTHANEILPGSRGGRRLPLGLRFRMGHAIASEAAATTLHPLDDVRIACQARVGAANTFASTLRWWNAQLKSRTVRYLFAGQQDGALTVITLVRVRDDRGPNFTLKTAEIYPALRSLKNDAVLFVSEPDFDHVTRQHKFSVVSTSSWRRWTIKQTNQDRDGKWQLVWPKLLDSLGLPTYQFARQEVYGLAMLQTEDRIAKTLTDIFAKPLSSQQLVWMVLLGRDGVRAVTYDSDHSNVVHVSGPDKNRNLNVQGEREDEKGAEEEDDVTDESSRMQSEAVPTDVESRSGVPQRHVTQRGHVKKELSRLNEVTSDTNTEVSANPRDRFHRPPRTTVVPAPGEPTERDVPWRKEEDRARFEEMTTKTRPANPYDQPSMAVPTPPSSQGEESSHRLTKEQYNKRLVAMAQRVDTMSTGLQSLRHSFKLFTEDVKDHMAFISMQLEQLEERVENEQSSS